MGMGAARRAGTVMTASAMLVGCTVAGVPVAGTAPTPPIEAAITSVGSGSELSAAPPSLAPDSVVPPDDDEPVPFDRGVDVQIALRADRAGVLPTGSIHSVGGIEIDDGEPVFAEGSDEPVAWLSPDTTRAEWFATLQAFPDTGLWPVLVDGLDLGDLERPWRSGELAGPLDVATDDGPALLETWWSQYEAEWHDDANELPAEWPGLSSGNPTEFIRISGYAIDGAFGEDPQGLLLVPVERPADVVAALGWQGPTNYATPGEVSSVLRHWESQHGAVPAFLSFDVLVMLATRPPGAPDQVTKVAAETFTLAPDIVWQGDTFPALVDEIDGSSWWYLWWD